MFGKRKSYFLGGVRIKCVNVWKTLKAGYNLQLLKGGKVVKTIRLITLAQICSLWSPQCHLRLWPVANRLSRSSKASLPHCLLVLGLPSFGHPRAEAASTVYAVQPLTNLSEFVLPLLSTFIFLISTIQWQWTPHLTCGMKKPLPFIVNLVPESFTWYPSAPIFRETENICLLFIIPIPNFT